MTPKKQNIGIKGAVVSLGSISSKWIVKEMKKYFDVVDHIDLKNIEVSLGAKTEVLHKGKPLADYDCVHLMGTFRYADLLRSISEALFSKSYVSVRSGAFSTGHDKVLTQVKLLREKIPMPTTYLSSSAASAKKILNKISFPIIMKLPKGTHGKGVMFADSFAAASSMLDALDALKQPFLIQEYVETGGVDTRAIVVGNKVVASMKRKAVSGEERANIHMGGKGEPCELDNYTKKIAINAAKTIGADICAVDLLEGIKGPVVIEVNLSPGLQGITGTTKINVADKIANFLYESAKEVKENTKEKGAKKVLDDLGIKKDNGFDSSAKEIITNLDFRSNRVLLPELATEISKFTEKDELILKVDKGKISIKKFDL